MKLEKKKKIAAKVLGVGKDRIVFNTTKLAEIKEAITRQDIRDLFTQKAITVKEIRGRLKVVRHKTSRRRKGSIHKQARDSKREYIIITRKLRAFIGHLRREGKLTEEKYQQLRREIRTRAFHSLAHMKEMGGLK
jgi:large subunit ribosomal protein L19e